MLTVLEAINKSADFLQKKGIESARINAELLLASVLKCKRLDLYLKFDKPLAENETEVYREFIRRRSNFEPLQYITGTVEFHNHELKVNPDVLIPRPETEILVETVAELLSQKNDFRILDIGTGSGAIAICLADKLISSKITAIDISDKALNVAKENTVHYNLENRINFLKFDILKDNLDQLGSFDVIVSNPPYVSMVEYKKLQKEITDYEPPGAVSDFEDGLKFYHVISEKSKAILNNNGLLFFEMAEGIKEKVEKILIENQFIDIKTVKDYSGILRIIYGIKK